LLDASNGEPYTPEEQAYIDSVEMGVEVPYKAGVTFRQALELEFPPVATHSAPDGLAATIRDRIRAVTGHYGNELGSAEELSVNDKDSAKATGTILDSHETLNESQRQEILQNMVAGHYQAVKQPTTSDTLRSVDTYGLKNETYLPKDRETLKAKVQRLLPASKAASPARKAARL
jgi:hypothetical protein